MYITQWDEMPITFSQHSTYTYTLIIVTMLIQKNSHHQHFIQSGSWWIRKQNIRKIKSNYLRIIFNKILLFKSYNLSLNDDSYHAIKR